MPARIAVPFWGSIVTVFDTIEPQNAEWHDPAPDSRSVQANTPVTDVDHLGLQEQ